MKAILLLPVSLLLASCAAVPTMVPYEKQGMFSGVYARGHNVTEPRPRTSAYLQTEEGGVALTKKGNGLFLMTKVIKSTGRDLYVTVDYENPDGTTLSNSAVLKAGEKRIGFSVPKSQKGLRGYRNYQVTVRLWNSKGDRTPLDTLVQPVRSYVDTTGDPPKVLRGMVW